MSIPLWPMCPSPGDCLHQDTAPCHKTHAISNCSLEHVFTVLKRLPRSPDLSPFGMRQNEDSYQGYAVKKRKQLWLARCTPVGGEFIWHIHMSGIKNTFHKMSTISFNNSSEAQQANFTRDDLSCPKKPPPKLIFSVLLWVITKCSFLTGTKWSFKRATT